AVIHDLDRSCGQCLVNDFSNGAFRSIAQGHATRSGQAFSGTVRTDDRRYARRKLEMRLVDKALESHEIQALENGLGLSAAAVDHLQLVAHFVTSSSSFAAAASCASRFEVPVPRATLPPTSTSTSKPR